MKFATLDQLIFSADKGKETEFQNQLSKFNTLLQTFERIVKFEEYSKLSAIIEELESFTLEVEGLNRLKFCVYKIFGVQFSSIVHLQMAFEIEEDLELLKYIAEIYFSKRKYLCCIEMAKSGLKLAVLVEDQIFLQTLIAKSLFSGCFYQDALRLLRDIRLVTGPDRQLEEMITAIEDERTPHLHVPEVLQKSTFSISPNASVGELWRKLNEYGVNLLSAEDSKLDSIADLEIKIEIDVMLGLEDTETDNAGINESCSMDVDNADDEVEIAAQLKLPADATLSKSLTPEDATSNSMESSGEKNEPSVENVESRDRMRNRRFTDLGKRSSMRFKEAVPPFDMELENVLDLEVEDLTVLNPNLVECCQFSTTGCKSSSRWSSINSDELIEQVQKDIVLKSGKPSRHTATYVQKTLDNDIIHIYTLLKDSDPLLFDEEKMKVGEFVKDYFPRKGSGSFSISNALLLMVFYILEQYSPAGGSSSALNRYIIATLQLTSKLLPNFGTLFENPHSEHFFNSQDKIDKLLNLCEILYDSLMDRSGAVLADVRQEFLVDDSNSDFLLSGRKSMLEHFMCRLSTMEMDLTAKIRHLWLLFKYYQLVGDAFKSVECLRECKSLLNDGMLINIPFVGRDANISAAIIDNKLLYFQMQVDIENTLSLFNEKEYQAVYDRLKPFFIDGVPGDGGYEMVNCLELSRKLEYLNILKQSAFALGKSNDFISALVRTTCTLLDSMESGIEDLFVNLNRLDLVLTDMCLYFDENHQWYETIDEMVFDELRYTILMNCQVSWILLLKCKNVPKTSTVIYAKKIKLIRELVSKSWLLFYHLIHYYQAGEITSREDLAEVLIWVHDSIGDSGMCCGNDGRFLKAILNHLTSLSQAFHHEIYQCLSCLYGTTIKANSQQLKDHRCVNKKTFNDEAATWLFQFIKPNLMGKIDDQAYRTIPKDWLDCLEKILDIYPSPDTNDHIIGMNLNIFKKFVCSDIHPMAAIPNHSQSLPMVNASNCYEIQKSLYYIYAEINLGLYYSRQDWNPDHIDTAIKNCIFTVIINPNDIDAWVSLASAYAAYSYDIIGRAVLQEEDKEKVADYQKAAWHCFVRAWKLVLSHGIELNVGESFVWTSTLWCDLGLLCESIVSAPMNGLALKGSVRMNKFMNSIATPNEGNALVVLSRQVYGIAAICFQTVLRIDPQWNTYLSLAHAFRKLGKDPISIIKLFFRGIHLMPRENISKEQDIVLDPIYKCLSFALKSYHIGKLSTADALDALNQLRKLHLPLDEQIQTLQDSGELSLPNDSVVSLIILFLNAIKRLDKRRWYHKPWYRLGWIQSNILKNDEVAKEELLTLLNIRVKLKRIWKTDLELPGRHFVYFTKYVNTLIDLSVSTGDIQLLWQLSKKVQTEDNLISKNEIRDKVRNSLVTALLNLVPIDESHLQQMLDQSLIPDPDVEKLFLGGFLPDPSNDLYRIVIAYDLKLKKTADILEKILATTYAKLYMSVYSPSVHSVAAANSALKIKESKLLARILQRAAVVGKTVMKEKSNQVAVAD